MRRRNLIINGALVASVATVGAVSYVTVGDPQQSSASTRTTTARVGDVTASVSASGNLASAVNLGVSFTDCTGKITSIAVRPGDKVSAGQALATVDNTAARTTLSNAQTALTNAQNAVDSTSDFAARPLSGSPTTAAPTTATPSRSPSTSTNTAVAAAQKQLRGAQQKYNSDLAMTDRAVAAAQNAVNQDNITITNAEHQLTVDESANPPVQDTIDADKAALDKAQADWLTDERALVAAEQHQTATLTKDQQAIIDAQNALAYAQQSALNTASSAKSASTDSTATRSSGAAQSAGTAGSASTQSSSNAGQSALDQAQEAVDAAKQTLADCTLKAPVAGSVTSVNGVVGATPGSGTGAASSSSGGNGSSGSGAGSGGSGSSSSNSGTSDGSGFITLSDMNQLQIKAFFSESDVNSIKAGQAASVLFSAVTNAANPNGTTVPGRVSAIDVTSTVSSNVVEYGVTVTLTNPPSTIRLGQTASVTVTTASKQNVVTVATNAITTTGPVKTVTVKDGGQTHIVVVQTGIAGGGQTEITSGLTDGQTVVLPTATGSSTTGGFPGGKGGLGGIAGRVGK